MDSVTFTKFFQPGMSIDRIKRLAPAPKTPIADLLYPLATARDPFPRSRVPVADLPAAVKNMPVIERGSLPYKVPKETMSVDGYEPCPIELEDGITDAELNDLGNITDEGFASYLDLKAQRLKAQVAQTIEALAAQSLSGALSYAKQIAPGQFESYGANFGSVLALVAPKLLSDNSAKWPDVRALITAAQDKIGDSGFGADIHVLCGASAFAALEALVTNANTKNVTITVGVNIVVPGATFWLQKGRYYDYKAKAWVNAIGDKEMVFVAKDAPFWLPQCALDNANANFAPLPFWFDQKRSQSGKGFTLTAESKPFPVPIVSAICRGDVIA